MLKPAAPKVVKKTQNIVVRLTNTRGFGELMTSCVWWRTHISRVRPTASGCFHLGVKVIGPWYVSYLVL